MVTIELTLDATRFATESLERTVDYTKLAAHAHALGATHIDLIETFAERLAEHCLAFAGVAAARIRVEKPRAVPQAMAGVEIVRLPARAIDRRPRRACRPDRRRGFTGPRRLPKVRAHHERTEK